MTDGICILYRTLAKINRHRGKTSRPAFFNKSSLAHQILAALRPLLPTGWPVYVQFQSWYAFRRLIKCIRCQGRHVTCGLKHNRTLNGKRLNHHARELV
ncbi:MAG: hypothetical protein D6768_20615 [Chloroflexi bacterium]|nr:MAG: hypothetical protein D6768_20615 [Chloroflexota bacterium]